MSHKAHMDGDRESHSGIIPTKRSNAGQGGPKEIVEGRPLTKENAEKPNPYRTQSRESGPSGLDCVRQAAKGDPKMQFTALLHHVNIDLLRSSYYNLKRGAAAGVDEVTWQEYGDGLEGRLVDLHGRIHRGAYHAKPSRRVWIDKEDGRKRPLGIAALEDKVVQQAVVTILNQIYEVDFRGFSYGFRPGRSPHQALDALNVGISRKRVNWILDADIRGFFDNMDHEWTMKFMEHRVADNRILRLIQKWLKAGVSEEGQWSETKLGTPQGAVVSPLLANVYLHYVFDLWAEVWREKVASGEVMIVRYADDLVVGFQRRADAEHFRKEFGERLAKFGLELHPEKTRLIEFGRFAEANRKRQGEGKVETFTFLGFTHYCGRNSKGYFFVGRTTVAKRMRAALQRIKQELRRQMHEPIRVVGPWLKRVVEGYYRYHAVPENLKAIGRFRDRLCSLWRVVLGRRSQNGRPSWDRIRPTFNRWIPRPRALHPYPNVRFYATHSR